MLPHMSLSCRHMHLQVEASNGIIMFGWTTAIAIAVVQRFYSSKDSVSGRRAAVERANKIGIV